MTIIGGLVVSQILTLYTTPVIYLLLDRLHRRLWGAPRQIKPGWRTCRPNDRQGAMWARPTRWRVRLGRSAQCR
jgi:hypothetical protein